MLALERAWEWVAPHWGYIVGVATILVGAWRGLAYFRSNVLQHKLRRCDEVTRSYIEYQQLCLKYPHLATSCFGTAPAHLDANDLIRRDLMFDVVTSIFERAFLAVREEGPQDVKNSQWPGWESFIRGFVVRADYQEWWLENVFDFRRGDWLKSLPQYDRRFEEYMHGLLARAAQEPANGTRARWLGLPFHRGRASMSCAR